jgi:hypothetical protein
MESVHDLLTKARDLYAKSPSHVAFGRHPSPGSHCPVTALQTVSIGLEVKACLRLLAMAAGLSSEDSGVTGDARKAVIVWNAETSTEDVLAAFDRAIAEAA